MWTDRASGKIKSKLKQDNKKGDQEHESRSKIGYITSDIWYSDVSSLNENGVTLRFDVFCISYRFGLVQRRLNSELLIMCQKNDIKTAASHTYLENIKSSAKAGEILAQDKAMAQERALAQDRPLAQEKAPAQIKPPAPVQQEDPQGRRKGFIDKIIEKKDR